MNHKPLKMKEDTTIANSASFGLAAKVKDYFQLIKFTLSFMVVFSTVISYLLAPNVRFDLLSVLLLFVAGMLVTGSANAINQILEKTSDGLMMRTAKRPVASGRMTVNEAGIFAFITGAAGTNPGCAAAQAGGGGGASDVRIAPYALANRVIVGAGGGGAGAVGHPYVGRRTRRR